MNIINVFENAFMRMSEKQWDCIYILIDLHGTIFTPAYNSEEKYEFYPYAKETLQLLSKRREIKLIIWSSTSDTYYKDYLTVLNNNNIFPDYFNENPEVVRQYDDPKQVSFDKKFYYNIGIDDRFGFEPQKDWKELYTFISWKKEYKKQEEKV